MTGQEHMQRNPIAQAALVTILTSLAEGPRAVPELPRAWPVTRTVLRAVLRRLVAAGLVEPAGGGRAIRFRLTDRGRTQASDQAARAA